MSRCEIMLPAVALRSPAITTPPSHAAATMVVPCGRASAIEPPPAARAPSRGPGAATARKSANDEFPALRYGAGSRGPLESGPTRILPLVRISYLTDPTAAAVPAGWRAAAYWPPFWTYERTNSSAFSSRTSSISSRIASTSSVSLSCRSLTSSPVWAALSCSSSLRRGACRWPPVSFVVMRYLRDPRCCPQPQRYPRQRAACPIPVSGTCIGRRGLPWPDSVLASQRGHQLAGGLAPVQEVAYVRPGAALRVPGAGTGAGGRLGRDGGMASQRGPQLAGGLAPVQEVAYVRPGAAQRLHGGYPLQGFPARNIENHRVPGRCGNRLRVLPQG